MTDLDAELAELALAIAREAGAMLRAGADRVRPVATKSSRHDLVTQMDRESERLIRDRIAVARPQDEVLGEEEGLGGSTAAAGAVRWIVDPLDGTVNYFYGIPSWGVSLGLAYGGEVRVGIVVAPALGEEYLAVRGEGSWLMEPGGRRDLAVSAVTDLPDALVSTGFGYTRERRAAQGRVIAALLPRVRDIRRVGSASVDLCWVARGRVDAHFERGLQEWDRAAGGLIAEEAGAVVSGLRGSPASEEMTVVAPPALSDQLVAELTGLAADRD